MGKSKTPELTALKLSGSMKEQYQDGRRTVSGEKNPCWKGGIIKSHSAGYIRVWLPESDPFHSMCDSNGYVYEHRLVMAQSLGRCLNDNEVVHHKNQDKTRNIDTDMKVCPSTGYHTRIHQVPTYIYFGCCYCGQEVKRLLWRVRKSKTGRFFCNNSCQAKYQYSFGISTERGGFNHIPPPKIKGA